MEKYESVVEISNLGIENVSLEFLNRLGHNTKLKLLLQLAKKFALPDIQKQLGKIKEEKGESIEYLTSLLLLFVAFVKGEEEELKEGLGSSSLLVRNAAVNFLVRSIKTAGSIDFLVNFALVTFVSLRKRIIKNIKRYKRRDIADKLLAGMKMFLPLKESCSLLTACSGEVVKESIGELGFGIKNWPSIAQYHPSIFIEYVHSVFLSSPLIDRPSLWLKFKRGFEKYVQSNKNISRYFDLIDQFSDPSNPLHPSITGLYGILIKRDKERVYEMLMRGPSIDEIAAGGIPRPILSNLRLFSYNQQLSLARILISNHIPDSLHPLFEVVPPAVRSKLFVDLYSEEHMKVMSWGSTLKYLNDDLVVKLVKFALDKKPAVKDEIHLNTLIPLYNEDVNQFFINKSKAHGAAIRAQALRSYIKWAGSVHRWDIVNSLIDQYQNDQAEVIQSLIMGFINIDGKGYTSQVLSLIEKITMIDKKRFENLGWNYLYSLSPILQRAIDYQINAALPSEESFNKALDLSMLISTSPLYNYRISSTLDHLPQPVVHKIIDIYLSFFDKMKNDHRQAKERATLGFITNLKHHFHSHPAANQYIKSTLQYKELGSWQLYVTPPLTRDDRLKELLLQDPSFCMLDIPMNHLHHRRQEWILSLLLHHPGYWNTLNYYNYKLIWKKKGGYQKWPYTTCDQYVTFSLTDNRAQMNQYLLKELKYICKVPTASISHFAPFLNIPKGKEEDPYCIAALEAALQYSAHLDSHMDRTLDLLIQHLHGDRARVAMYSIPRVVRFLPTDHLESVFRQQLNKENNKITVQKEWIRLIGVYGVGVDVLFEYWKKEKVSRDVRVAISHACRSLLYKEEVWGLLEEIAEYPNKDVCGSILSLPPSLSPSQRSRYAKLILKVCKAADHVDTRRLAYQSLVKFSQGIEKEIIERAMEAMVDMKYNNEWYAALTCLIQVSASSSQPDAWISSIKQLLQIPMGDLTPSKMRDLPSIQRFLRFLDYLSSLLPFYRKLNEGVYEEISKIIAGFDEVWIVDACRIKLAIITEDNDIEKIVRVLREVAILTASQIYNLPLLIQVVDHVWSKSLQKVQDKVVMELYKDDSSSVRYFAFFLFELTLYHRNQSSTNVIASSIGYQRSSGRRVRNAVVRDSLKDDENTRVYCLPYFGAIYMFRQDPLSPPSSVPDPQLTLEEFSLLYMFRQDPCEGIRALSSRVFFTLEPIY